MKHHALDVLFPAHEPPIFRAWAAKEKLVALVNTKRHDMLNHPETTSAHVRFAGKIEREEFEEFNAYYVNLESIEFVNCTFIDCNFNFTLFNLCKFENCIFESCNFEKCVMLSTAHVSSIFKACNFTWAHFSAHMTDTQFSRCDLTDCNLASLDVHITSRFNLCEGVIDMGADLKGMRYIAIRRKDGSGGGYNLHWADYSFARCQVVHIFKNESAVITYLPPYDPKFESRSEYDHRLADLWTRIEMTDKLAISRGWKIVRSASEEVESDLMRRLAR